MGEKPNQPFQFSFNRSLKVDFQGSRVTSDGGLILIRELDERLGLEKLIEKQLSDSRQGLNKQFTLADLLRQSVYSRLAGYEDLNDAERLAADPTFRLISSQRIWDRGAALTSTLHWFETELLAKEENLIGLMAEKIPGVKHVTLGGDKNYDTQEFVRELRHMRITPHVTQNSTNRSSAIDQRTTRHAGYGVSQRKRKLVEQSFGWMKVIGMLKKVKLRGAEKVGWLFTFTGAAYNLCRLRNLHMQAVG